MQYFPLAAGSCCSSVRVLGVTPTPSLLHVVETNPFRHLNHLSLKFVPASDAYLKKYLAECLVALKVWKGEAGLEKKLGADYIVCADKSPMLA